MQDKSFFHGYYYCNWPIAGSLWAGHSCKGQAKYGRVTFFFDDVGLQLLRRRVVDLKPPDDKRVHMGRTHALSSPLSYTRTHARTCSRGRVETVIGITACKQVWINLSLSLYVCVCVSWYCCSQETALQSKVIAD